MPLTYYQQQATGNRQQAILMCHHCGFEAAVPEYCENCQSWKLITLGGGTEKVESDLKKEFSGVNILRLDKEIAPKILQQKKTLKEFFDGESNILIVTSLLFQYLPSSIINCEQRAIKLIGIISIDSLLSLPDFRAEEEGTRIIKKLLSLCPEKLLLQTFWPKSKVFAWINNPEEHNYFLEETLKEREKYFYPPFSQLIKLTFSHKNQKKAEREAYELKRKMEEQLTVYNLQPTTQFLGPAPMFVPKFKGKYRWTILIKIKSGQPKIKNRILEMVPPDWKIDVDPVTTL